MSQVTNPSTGVFPPGSVVQTITGNTGGPVGPDLSNNINIIGSGIISVAGNPGTHTETISITTPIPVADGGTGDTTLTLDGVLIGNGTSPVIVTAAGTTGQVLTGVTGSAPIWAAPATSGTVTSISAGTGITLTPNPITSTGSVALTIPVSIADGGTNATSMTTTDGTIYYDGTRLVTTATGTSGFVLTSGGAGVAPTYQTVSASGAVTSVNAGANISITGTATAPIVNVAGTTNHAVQVGTGATGLTSLTVGTNGQVLLGSTAADPAFVTPTAGTGLSITTNATTLAYALSVPVSIADGGTNATSFAVTDGTVYFDGTRLVTVAATGSAGNILTSNGVGVAPSFQAGAGSTISITGDTGGAITSGSFTFTGGTTGITFAGSGTTETLTGTLVVANGGTGRATLTNHGVLVGAGTAAITQLAVGTTGQVLTGVTGADPVFASPAASSITITGDSGGGLTGNSFTFTGGTTGLAFAGAVSTETLGGTLVVANGGTGAVTLTSHGVLLGNTTSAVTATAAGTTGQVLTGVTGAAPTFQSPAASSISITGDSGGALTGAAFTFTGGTTGLTFAGAGSTETLGGTLVVANGGTGATSFTAFAPVCGGTTTTAALQSAATGIATSGFILTSTGSASLPTWQANAGSATAFNSIVVQVFTSSGTYTPTSGMKYCTIEVVGGGAGGGAVGAATAAQVAAAGGGGAGGYARKTVTAATIGASQTVTVGTGGAGGAAGVNNGVAGVTSSVGVIVSATGGALGVGSAAGATANCRTGGNGGVGSGGDINVNGGTGLMGFGTIAAVFGGVGGQSYFGGAQNSTTGVGTVSSAGNPGSLYGSGGGGAICVNGAAAGGGAGAAGIVVITEFIH